MNPGTLIALNEAKATLVFSEEIMAQLRSCWPSDDGQAASADFTLSPRHARELHQYLEAHRAKMREWYDKVKSAVDAGTEAPAPSVNLLASYRFDLDAAMRFVAEAFIKPRRSAGSARALEAADWMCVEGFRAFLDHAKVPAKSHPVGPVVALDSQRSPAVWRESAELRIPSLFAESIPIRKKGGDLKRMLPPFPVICLPSDLAELPEYYPLLSHEVGHAVDDAIGISSGILAALSSPAAPPISPNLGYWKTWMREIVADVVGVALSGGAFAVALWRFAQRRSLDRKLSESNVYPPMELRILFLRSSMELLGHPNPNREVLRQLPGDAALKNLPELATTLKNEFERVVLPVIRDRVLQAVPDWEKDEKSVADAVKALRKNRGVDALQLKFRLLPSVFTLAITDEADTAIRDRFKSWHDEYRRQAKPEWISKQSRWRFTEDELPSLRPTLLGPDGVTKFPPVVLLTSHRSISFLGSTNKWLLGAIKEAMNLRQGVPWKRIDVFFASDALLAQVERYEGEARISIETLKAERDRQIKDLGDYFKANAAMIKKWTFRMFDGPPLFASFWDWEERGGRIHVSSQLFGIDIGRCPSADHLWLRDEPTPAYTGYVNHLKTLEKIATRISP